MTWTNPLSILWYVTTPTPGVIIFNGSVYTLSMPGISGFAYQASNLSAAQSEYVTQATTLLATSIALNPQVPALSLPADQQIVAVELTNNGGFAIGTWSSANQNLTVAAQTIPVASIVAWSSLP
jgi:hypothetical protein